MMTLSLCQNVHLKSTSLTKLINFLSQMRKTLFFITKLTLLSVECTFITVI